MNAFFAKYKKLFQHVQFFEKLYLIILPIAATIDVLYLISKPSFHQLAMVVIMCWLWEEVYKRNVLEQEKAGVEF